MSATKTVVVLGAAYGGARASQILAAGLPEGWRILLIDRNSYMSTFSLGCQFYPDTSTKHKNPVIPLSKVFLLENSSPLHRCLQATVISIHNDSITLSKAFPEHGLASRTVPYDYMVYALGSHLPPPLNLWGTSPTGNVVQPKGRQLPAYQGMKSEGIAWMKEHQKIVDDAPTVLVVGGGALGIQYATDIATIYPEKRVTLLHSRKRLLPRFDEAMHDEILKVLETIENIDLILGERLDTSSVTQNLNARGQRIARTVSGREIAADLLLMCTGQTPNTSLLKALDPSTVNPNSALAHVLRTMQLGVLPILPTEFEVEDALQRVRISDSDTPTAAPGSTLVSTPIPTAEEEEEPIEELFEDTYTPYPHIFVVGDAADAFGAIPAGHNAYYQVRTLLYTYYHTPSTNTTQGEIAARNILRLIKRAAEDGDEPLERYTPGQPAIKVSLGLDTAVFQSQGIVGRREGGAEDLGAALMWPVFGFRISEEGEMYE
ncbi:hypothetical protein C0995_012635 [Termitomyces sp. Mi166|nr:hypothetical protein C0995_012635 [Termitomyces sp. Mi166\